MIRISVLGACATLVTSLGLQAQTPDTVNPRQRLVDSVAAGESQLRERYSPSEYGKVPGAPRADSTATDSVPRTTIDGADPYGRTFDRPSVVDPDPNTVRPQPKTKPND